MAEVEFNRRKNDANFAHTQTEIAVLQVQVKNLDEKVEVMREELREAVSKFEHGCEDTIETLDAFKESLEKDHNSLAEKISAIEKWRWMLIGGGIVLGSLGSGVIEKFFTAL